MHPLNLKVLWVGLVSGFVGNGILGALFSLPFINAILYNPRIQSELFIQVTPTRDIPASVIGLIILSIIPTYLFITLARSIPGKDWFYKGIFWGFSIWGMFWVMQEWFIYHTLLREPFILNFLELALLLIGSLAQGLLIAWFYKKEL